MRLRYLYMLRAPKRQKASLSNVGIVLQLKHFHPCNREIAGTMGLTGNEEWSCMRFTQLDQTHPLSASDV
jgi:hypothetical protein